MSFAAAKTSSFVCGTPVKTIASKPRVQRQKISVVPRAKYGDADQYFDLDDLEDTVGSWDLYGQQDDKRYPQLQSEFFERAGSSLTRRESIRGFLVLGGLATFLLFGIKGASDANLPITIGPQTSGEKGPRGKI